MEYVGGESLREVRARHREEAGRPLPVAAGDRLHPRDPAGARISAPAGPALLRLQARQRHPDGGAAHTDRPGRCPAATETEDSDLYGTVGYQAPEVPAHGASASPRICTPWPDTRRPQHRVRRLPGREALRHSLPPRAGRAGIPALRVLPPVPAEGDRGRSQPRFHVGRRHGGAARRRAAPGGRGGRGKSGVRAQRALQRRARSRARRNPWQLLPVPAVDPNDPAAGVWPPWPWSGRPTPGAAGSTPAVAELSLNLARSAIEDGEFETALQELDSPEARESGWRARRWRGVLHAGGRPAFRRPGFFAAVAAELPGELAPKLAHGGGLEQAGGQASDSPRPMTARAPP